MMQLIKLTLGDVTGHQLVKFCGNIYSLFSHNIRRMGPDLSVAWCKQAGIDPIPC
jgi:hypothetical protein